MGCFNKICSVSNLPLTNGDDIVLIPIIPTNSSYTKETLAKVPKCGNIYAYDMFIQTALPIYGEYNDYGSIENIKRTKNVEIIENYFNMSIEEFVNIITCGRGIELTDFYSGMSEYFVGKKLGIKKNPYSIEEALNNNFFEKLGFEKVDDKTFKNKDRNIDFLIEDNTLEVVIGTNSEKFKFDMKDIDEYIIEKTNLSIFLKTEDFGMFNTLSKITHTMINREIYDNFSKYDLSFKTRFFEEMNSIKKEVKYFCPNLEEKTLEEQKTELLKSFVNLPFNNYIYPQEYKRLYLLDLILRDGEIEDEYLKISKFIYNLNALSIPLMVSHYGGQDIEDEKLMSLYQLSINILQKKIDKYREDYDEE